MTSSILCFSKDDTGATSIEYALLASLIAMLIVFSGTTIGTNLSQTFTTVSNGFPAAP